MPTRKPTGRPAGRPTDINDALTERVVSAMKGGCGYLRAAAIQGIPQSTAARWKRRGRNDIGQGKVDTPYAKFAQAVMVQEAKVIAMSERTVHRAAVMGDVHAAKWVLNKLLPEEYGDKMKIEVTEEVQSVLEEIKPLVSRAAWMEVIGALARIHGVDTEPAESDESRTEH